MLLLLSFHTHAEKAYLMIHNHSNSYNVGLYHRLYFILQQLESADNQGNYAAWLMSIPFCSSFNYLEYVVSRDYFIWHDQQCLFKGRLTDYGLELTQIALDDRYFRCEVVGNHTKMVTIHVYSR